MATKTNATKTNATKTSPARRARLRAERVAKRVADMTPEERERELEKIAADFDRWAPTPESVRGDLLVALNVVAAEFVRRYYPEATAASVHITKYHDGPGMHDWSVHLPVAVPKKG